MPLPECERCAHHVSEHASSHEFSKNVPTNRIGERFHANVEENHLTEGFHSLPQHNTEDDYKQGSRV